MPGRWEFSNDCFRRGDKRLLCDIVRRKLTAAAAPGSSSSVLTVPMEPSTSNSGEGVFSTNSSPSAYSYSIHCHVSGTGKLNSNNGSTNIIIHSGSGANLMDENDRLKKENTQLCKEFKQMKSMCTNIYSTMSNYNPGSGPVLGQGHWPGVVCGSSNSSQTESTSTINPLNLLSGQKLLATAVVTQAAQVEHAAMVIPSALADMILNPNKLQQSGSRF